MQQNFGLCAGFQLRLSYSPDFLHCVWRVVASGTLYNPEPEQYEAIVYSAFLHGQRSSAKGSVLFSDIHVFLSSNTRNRFMRIRLTLKQLKSVESLPINTGYYIASVIYATLAQDSAEFATRLHDNGYASEGARQKFKYFTFSNLQIPVRKLERGRIVSRSREVSFYLSSPKEDFLQHLINGLFSSGHMRIQNALFEKQLIEVLPEPEWSERMTFSMLSPLAVSVYREPANGMNAKEYLRYDDPRLAGALMKNLQAKYRGLYGVEAPGTDTDFSVRFAERYLKRKQEQGRSVEKLITVKAGNGQESRVKAIECPFIVTGHPELLKVGYDCGFGENNPMGFGMVRADR